MDQPINYQLDVQTPFQAALAGYQGGAAIRNDQQQQQQLEVQRQAQAQQQQLLSSLANNPNATGADYARVMTQIPGIAEPLQKAWAARSTEQQQSMVSDLSQWGAAIKNGAPQIATQMMNARADAMEQTAGGPTPESRAMRTNAQVVEAHPQFALGMIQAKLAAHPDGSKVATTLSALGGEKRAEDQAPFDLKKKQFDAETAEAEAKIKGAAADVAPRVEEQKLDAGTWNIANTKSQITERAQRLGLDRDKLSSETQTKLLELQQKFGELPEYVAKDVATATTDAISAQQSGARMNGLAAQIEAASADLGSGVTAKAGELWKKTFGSQNELTRLRAEFSRIVTPAAMAAYKTVASGSTSDKDIETAMVGVPKDTDSPERMAQFLRGAAKLQVYDSVLNNAKSEWLGAVRTLGKAKTDIEIDGVQVPAGTTFKNFTEQYVTKKVAEQTAASTVGGRGYMRFAAPAAAPATGGWGGVSAAPVVGVPGGGVTGAD